MKTIIFISITALFFSACSDKYKSLRDIDHPPVIGFSKDTVFLRVGDTTTNAGLTAVYTADADENLQKITFTDTSSQITAYYDKKSVTTGTLPIITDSTMIFFVVHAPGKYAIPFTLYDRFNKTATKNLIIKTLSNTNPTAKFSIEQTASMEYAINASLSTDPYGYITQYQFTIDGNSIETYNPVIKQVFYSKGLHTISLTVENDLQQVSPLFSQTLNVQ